MQQRDIVGNITKFSNQLATILVANAECFQQHFGCTWWNNPTKQYLIRGLSDMTKCTKVPQEIKQSRIELNVWIVLRLQ